MAAGLLESFVLPGSNVPMIGASGAIAGVLGAYLVLYPHARIASLVPILFIFTIIEIPAAIFLLFWFVSQLFSGWLTLQGSTGAGLPGGRMSEDLYLACWLSIYLPGAARIDGSKQWISSRFILVEEGIIHFGR